MDIDSDVRLDVSRVFCTSAQIKRVGRAVAVCLEDATLPGNAKHPHMVVLYRGGRRWSKEEVAAIEAAAAQWKRERNGHESAPTTFTLSEWGNASAAIRGDLEALCLALRQRFASMSSDAQRIPHVELFRGDLKRRRAKTAKAAKVCLLCGSDAHFKRRCPHNAKFGKAKSMKAKAKAMVKGAGKRSKGAKDKAKEQQRLTAMLSRLRTVRERKDREAAMLREHETKMEALLCVADALDADALCAAIADIAHSFKAGKRSFKAELKMERGAEKAKRKEAKREQKQRRKQQKRDRKSALQRVRCSSLPMSRLEIGGASVLRVHIDGYNAMGADKLCRKAMRSRRSQWARARMARLIQRRFVDAFDAAQRGFGVAVTLWFDGKARAAKANANGSRFSVAFAFAQSVDDALVSRLSANDEAQNRAVFVVSSDKALALRLDALGVRVVKSGAFYKGHLKAGDDGDDDEKETAMMVDEDGDDTKEEQSNDADEDFLIVSQKMAHENETDSGDGAAEGDGDASPDADEFEAEGSVHCYASPFNPNDDGEEDHEFTQIFGEMDDEMDMI